MRHSVHVYFTRNLFQRDLRGLARAPGYEDTRVVCSDGARTGSRLILGLVIPELATVTSFSLMPEVREISARNKAKRVSHFCSV